MTVSKNSSENVDQETLDRLVAQALELSELALKSGKPEASALLTLAASDLRKKAG